MRGLKYFVKCAQNVRNFVAPFAGAWIEITPNTSGLAFFIKSHPSRVRGLKSATTIAKVPVSLVAPFTGAWIEILQRATVY